MLLSINEFSEYMLDEVKKKFYIIYNYLMKQKRLKYLIITSLGSRVEIFLIMWIKCTFNWFKKYKTIKIFLIQDTEDIIHFICMTKWLFNI